MNNQPNALTSAEILQLVSKLPVNEQQIMRLKALFVPNFSKTELLPILKLVITNKQDVANISIKTLNETFERLRSKNLLEDDFSCNSIIQHPLAVATMSDRFWHAVATQILKSQPDVKINAYYYVASDSANLLRRLRFAIYANDIEAYKKLINDYNKGFRFNTSHVNIINSWFLNQEVELDWLNSRNPIIQYDIVAPKLELLLHTGTVKPELPGLLAFYRAKVAQPEYANFWLLLQQIDILAGRTDLLRQRLAASESATIKQAAHTYLQMRGAVEFLEGRNDNAIVCFRQALKVYKKAVGKRRIFFTDAYGVFFLLALLHSNDPSLHAEIETNLDAAAVTKNDAFVYSNLAVVRVLLLLQQGLEVEARELLRSCRTASLTPLATACLTITEFLVDPKIAQEHINITQSQFTTFKNSLPLLARMHAEVLQRLAVKTKGVVGASTVNDGKEFLATAISDVPLRNFIEIIPIQQPWERALGSLATFLQGANPDNKNPQAAVKSKRLIWVINQQDGSIEALEQSLKVRGGWSSGRAITMKRLYDQDPSLDYLTEQDWQALRTIRKLEQGWHDEHYFFDPYDTLLSLVGHPLLFDAANRERSITLVTGPVELVVSEHKDGYKLVLSHSAKEATVFLEPETPTRWRVVDFSADVVVVRNILGDGGLIVPKQAKEQVLTILKAQHPSLPIHTDIADADIPTLLGQADAVLQIQPLETGGIAGGGGPIRAEGLKVTMVVRPFGPAGPYYLAGQGGKQALATIDGRHQRVSRDFIAERQAAEVALAALPTLRRETATGHEWELTDAESALEFLLELQKIQPPILVEWPEGKQLKVHNEITAKRLSISVARSRDWFQVEGQVQVDEELVLDMQDLLQRLGKASGRFVPLDDGSFVALTHQLQKQLERLSGITEVHGKGLRLSTFGALAARELVESSGTVEVDKAWQAMVERVAAAERYKPEIPSTLQAELRDYQVEGFKWLARLAYWQAGGCLADDMGLGKTVQAIAVMLQLAPNGPCLVVAPTSVCHNWEHELERFAPTLVVHRLGAANTRAEQITKLQAMDVLVTSYGLLYQEIDHLAEIDWRMAVFDEAQALKNAETRRFQAGQQIKAQFRLALTGTPVENYLDDLWSLFTVVNPGLLGSRDSFTRRFTTPIERNRDNNALQSLRALIRPFILRRTKSAVLTELPPRTELTLEIDLPDEERAFYEALRRRALEHLAELRTSGSAGKNRIHILAEITKLRRACCNPSLIDANTQIPGAKLAAFLDLVAELLSNRHKALVFSQFVGQLELVRNALDAKKISYQYLDGSTSSKDRERRVEAFQTGSGDLFLISLKAGGTGLNLTAADYVIHLDPWWNPAVEDQASDRAHRIGQQRPVTVYRLIVRDSIEEKILALHRNKRDLADDILEGSEVSARLSEEDLVNLIRI